MPTNSAGILMYRSSGEGIEVLLAHPGGPFWRKRDLGAWSLPKGELSDGEDPETAARREFEEELGVAAAGPLQSLGQVRQRAGKTVLGYAMEGDLDVNSIAATTLRSNGRHAAAAPCAFLKSIARSGFRSPSPGKRFSQANAPLSIALKYSGRTRHNRMVRKHQYEPRPKAGDAP